MLHLRCYMQIIEMSCIRAIATRDRGEYRRVLPWSFTAAVIRELVIISIYI